jgi:hypothetical protein
VTNTLAFAPNVPIIRAEAASASLAKSLFMSALLACGDAFQETADCPPMAMGRGEAGGGSKFGA